jgi:antitoxin VapB
MALYLNNEQTERLARELAELAGETLTDAVRISLEERLRRERLKRGRNIDRDAIRAIQARVAGLPVLDTGSDSEILGYDENGLPS